MIELIIAMVVTPKTKAKKPAMPVTNIEDLVLSPVRRIVLLNVQPATPKAKNNPTTTLLIDCIIADIVDA